MLQPPQAPADGASQLFPSAEETLLLAASSVAASALKRALLTKLLNRAGVTTSASVIATVFSPMAPSSLEVLQPTNSNADSIASSVRIRLYPPLSCFNLYPNRLLVNACFNRLIGVGKPMRLAYRKRERSIGDAGF